MKTQLLVMLIALGLVASAYQYTPGKEARATPILTAPTSTPATSTPTSVVSSPLPSPSATWNIHVTMLQEQGGRVSWSHAKNLIAFDVGGKEGKSDIYVARLDGSDKRCLTCDKKDVPQLQNGNPEWHPSGEFIVFQAQDPNLRVSPGAVGNFITSPGIGINNNIWIANADGSKFWQITRVQNRFGVLHPHFSRDGKKIVWSEIVKPGGEMGGQWAIKLADFAVENGAPRVTNIQTLTPGNLELYETHGFSPDNRKIIFSGVPQGKFYYAMEIYTYDLSTQQLTRLTANDEWDEHAHYSPDGASIIWISSADIPQIKTQSLEGMTRNPPKTDVWMMNADGSNKRRITRFNDPNAPEGRDASGGVIVGDLSWGPDGRSFVAKIQRGRVESIVLIELGATPATRATPPPPKVEPKAGASYLDVTYCTPEGIAQKMNLFYPKSLSDKPMPIAVYVHGGGWTSGDKGSGAGSADMQELLARGYIVASLDYRLAPQSKWPSQITDVKCAIRHLRAHAAMYHLDPNRIGVWGGSAGGHLVAMLGTTDARAGFDVGEYLDQSSRVQAVVDLFGPADLPAMLSGRAFIVAQTVFGATSRDDPVLVKASPVTYITPDDPPFLILHGDKDTVVPLEQSQILYDKLKAGGVHATFVIVKNAGHGFTPSDGTMSPSRAELTKMIADFFDQHLK
ncbi:MAG: alpha/beta hydrolase fold domain-containing protein [Anaerolineae bacterium]|nr:alpha/beta hydrolase fold domain-containing protein [Anaerolineae bacterium]